MSPSDLHSKYQRLRSELEAAYAAPVWNSRQIDQIADEIVRTEKALVHRSRFLDALAAKDVQPLQC